MEHHKLTYLGRWFRDWLGIMTNELKMIWRDGGVMLIFCFAGLVYPLLYSWIYGGGMVEEMPVAVVDQSRGEYSRRYLGKVDATRECRLCYDCADMEEARALMAGQKVHGIIHIPADFDSRIVRMEQATVSTYADMSTFLYYKNLMIATNKVMLDEVHQIQAEHYSAAGYTAAEAEQLISPVEYDEQVRYNPAISYTLFFVPMVLMMILQQVMFYGSAMLAGTLREQHRSFATLTENLSGIGMGRVVLGRGAAYFLVFLGLGVYGTLLVPHLFHLPQAADWTSVLVLLVFYVMDIIFFSFTWSTIIDRRETVFVLLLFMSPICVFLTGLTWPASNFPLFWRWVSYLFPSTFGCKAYMTLSNSGSLAAIAPEMLAMTAQIVAYYVLASLAVLLENRYLERKREASASLMQ
ncbi:MAG: ABC transporter permease [Bacteroidales bacterium]|nr:ABC transporter permease [Bacteroidales bacterium]